MRPALLDRRPQRGTRAEEVGLPDELAQLPRPGTGRERAIASEPVRGPVRGRGILIEEGVHQPSIAG